MATPEFPARRLIVVGGFAAAIAIPPAIAVFAGPSPTIGTPMAACPAGEHEDPYTYACIPELVPAGTVAGPGAPSEQQVTQCSGTHRAQCLEQFYYGNPGGNVPHVDETVHQSP